MQPDELPERAPVSCLRPAQQLRFLRSSHAGPQPTAPRGGPTDGGTACEASRDEGATPERAQVLSTVGQHIGYDNRESPSFWPFRMEDGNNHTVSDSDRPNGSDQREHPRAPISLKVEYKRLNSFFADYTRNISKGGTFIRTERPLPIGTEFHFELVVPKLQEPLRLRGKVQWIVMPDLADADTEPGMGIGFIYDSEAERARIEGVVEELMVESLGPVLYEKLLKPAT